MASTDKESSETKPNTSVRKGRTSGTVTDGGTTMTLGHDQLIFLAAASIQAGHMVGSRQSHIDPPNFEANCKMLQSMWDKLHNEE